MSVAEANDVFSSGTEILCHLLEEGIRTVFSHVNRVQRLIAVHERHGRAGQMTAEWTNVETKRQAAEIFSCFGSDVRTSPFIRHVRQLLLVFGIRSAAAVLVIGCDSR